MTGVTQYNDSRDIFHPPPFIFGGVIILQASVSFLQTLQFRPISVYSLYLDWAEGLKVGGF